MSKVVSSINLRAYVIPGHGNKITIELLGEDGRLFARKILQYEIVSRWVYVALDIPFEIRAVAETARLQISTRDEAGRMKALSSVQLLLLSEGFEEINPPDSLPERCTIKQPSSGAGISGGVLHVDGSLYPFNSQPLVIELVAADGRIVGRQSLPIQPALDDGYLPFSVDIAYNVSRATWVRLTLSQADERIAGLIYLYSQEVLLNP